MRIETRVDKNKYALHLIPCIEIVYWNGCDKGAWIAMSFLAWRFFLMVIGKEPDITR